MPELRVDERVLVGANDGVMGGYHVAAYFCQNE